MAVAQMYPQTIAPETQSYAERNLFQLFRDKLSNDFRVFHSVHWNILRPKTGSSPIGEADFVLAHPELGLLILEVKGGSIRVDSTGWYSRPRNSPTWTRLKQDPAHQARGSVFALKEHLKSDVTNRFDYMIHYGLAFPDIRLDTALRPDLSRAIILDESNLDNIEAHILSIYRYWHQRYGKPTPLPKEGMKALVDLLSPTLEIPARFTRQFQAEADEMKRLTESQYQVLRMLRRYTRAAIAGGAGTGKTMIAEEKMRQLVNSGFRVLFLCYNNNLKKRIEMDAEPLNSSSKPPVISTYLSLNNMLLQSLNKPTISVENWTVFEARIADMLTETISLIRTQKPDLLFDAIIVDEAQDFRAHWWIPLPDLLTDPVNGILYTFFDDNQRLYEQVAEVPLPDRQQEPYLLDTNCRNTQQIFKALKPFATTPTASDITCAGPEGLPIERHPVKTAEQACEALKSVLEEWIVKRGITTDDIIILTPRAKENSQWQEGQRLGKFSLTWNLDDSGQNIRVCTIHSFKGLESPVVILTEMNAAKLDNVTQLAYIGISRARHHLVLLGYMPNVESTSGESA